MNDAERDAWLREALRHAPDAGALPPRGVSEAILAEARANALQAQAVPPRAAHSARAAPRHPLAAFWDWLARPPVAASFASVMAATLVGLMWWDRPMDETLPRRPDVTSEPAAKPASSDVAAAQSKARLAGDEPAIGAAAKTTAPATEPRGADATASIAPAPQPRRQLPAEEGAATRDAKVASPPAGDKRKVEDEVVAKENAERVARKATKPSPFPAAEDERSATPAAPALEKKDTGDRLARSADSAAPAGAAAESSMAAAPPPPAAARPPESARLRAATGTAAPAGRRADQDQASASTANSGALDAAKSAPALAAAQPVPVPRSGALADGREKQASAFASSPAATRNEVVTAQSESRNAAATPLAALLASIASEPAQWSRSSANGGVVALDPGWRDWLAQLDAAANGRWRRVGVGGDGGAATSGGRDGATTLRLVQGGRPAGVVWLDGTSVRVDGAAPGERWQAILPPAAADQLRAAAERLAR